MNDTVAKTILQQLGGSRFLAMTGASNLLFDECSLHMRIPGRNAKSVTRVRIALLPTDEYVAVAFAGTRNLREVASAIVQADGLREWFEEATGLRTSL